MRRQPGRVQNALMGASLLLLLLGWTMALALGKDWHEPVMELSIGMVCAVGVAVLVWLFPYRQKPGDPSKVNQYLNHFGVWCGLYCGFSLVLLLLCLVRALVWQPLDVSKPVYAWVRPLTGLVLLGLSAVGAFALWLCSRDDQSKGSADE